MKILKSLFLCGFLISASIGSNAQTLNYGGKLAGLAGSTSEITRMVVDGGNNTYVIGLFTDSLQLDITGALAPSGYYLLADTPGEARSFVAKYDQTGTVQWGFVLGQSSGLVRLHDVAVDDFYGRIVIGGSYSGIVNFSPNSTPNNFTSVGGWDGFFASYDLSGNYNMMYPLVNGGGNCEINDLYFDGSDLLATGYFDGVLDIDPDTAAAAVSTIAALVAEDAFIARYDYNFDMVYTRAMGGNGNEAGLFIAPDGSGGVIAAGYFDNNIDLDWDTPVVNQVTNGSRDIYYVHYSSSFNYLDGFHIGGLGNDVPSGLMLTDDYRVALLSTFEGSMDLDPLGSTANVTSEGLTDVGISKYELDGTFIRGKRLGNINANPGYFMTQAPFSMPARSAIGNFYIGFGFSGTIDIDPGAATENITSSNTVINSVMLELDSTFSKVWQFSIEGQKTTGMAFNPYSPNDILLAGSFAGTNVDIVPYDLSYTVSNSSTNTAFLTYFNECQLTVEITMPNPYPCGTCSATLLAVTQGAIAGYEDIYWPTGSNTLHADNLCPGTYSVSITDGHGCMPIINPMPFEILNHDTASGGFYAEVAAISSSCGNSMGSASATVHNAVGDYTYDWSNGDTTAVTDSLAAGIYSVNITDELNCYITETFSISDSDGPSIIVSTITNASCSGGTGSIDITVTGGAAPLTYLWSNGATTEDLINATPGTYAVIVTDANGCRSQTCVTLTEPTPATINLAGSTFSTCLTADGSLAVEAVGGLAPYTYQWDAAAGSSTNDTVTALAAGTYEVTATDGNGCTTTRSFSVSDIGGPYKNWSYSNNASCTEGPGSIFIDIVAAAPYTTVWSHGETTQYAINIPEGGIYFLTVTDAAGCITVFEEEVMQTLPYTPNVCMVTVDSTGTKNVIIWDKSVTPDAVYYNVYREGFCSSDEFLPIGSVDHDSLSLLEDTVVNTETKSWQYYVTAVDSCGYESLPSEINRTIHLTAVWTLTDEVLLNWEAYIGREVSRYDIFRVDATDSTVYNFVDSVTGLTLNYLDDIDFSPYEGKDIEYYVEAITVNPCFASRAFNQNASRSNHSRVGLAVVPNDTTSVGQVQGLEEFIKVYPNPANDRIEIRTGGTDKTYQAVLTNQLGQPVKTFEVNRHTIVSVKELQQGIYYLRLSGENSQNRTYKLVITH